jgi:hypothetical protein
MVESTQHSWLLIALLVALVLWTACTSPPPPHPAHGASAPGAAATDDEAATPYSPFTVEVAGVEAFDHISFKDVGLRPGDAWVHEVLASGLAEELMTLAPDPVAANVSFDPAFADPAHHVACGDAHVYVDVWHSESPDRLGYSLWSGCEEDAQFAWREVPVPEVDWEDAATTLAPLTAHIASALGDALETGCFRRTC